MVFDTATRITLDPSDIEAEGSSCWWFRLEEDLGIKVFKATRDTEEPKATMYREFQRSVDAASTGVGPKVFGFRRLRFAAADYWGIVMERLQGEPGKAVYERDPDFYLKSVAHATGLLKAAGITPIDVRPNNVIFVQGRARLIDYGPVKGCFPKDGA